MRIYEIIMKNLLSIDPYIYISYQEQHISDYTPLIKVGLIVGQRMG